MKRTTQRGRITPATVLTSRKDASRHMVVLALIVALMFWLPAAIRVAERLAHSLTWTPVDATVTWVGRLCELRSSYTMAGPWRLEEITTCDQADLTAARLEKERPTPHWQRDEADYVKLTYWAAHEEQQKIIRLDEVSQGALALSETLSILVDPKSPRAIDRQPSSHDARDLARRTGLAIAAAIAAVLLGQIARLLVRMVSR